MKEDEMGGTCSTHGMDEIYIHYFDWSIWWELTTWKT